MRNKVRIGNIMTGGCGSDRLDRNVIRTQTLEEIMVRKCFPFKLDATVVSGCDFIFMHKYFWTDGINKHITYCYIKGKTLLNND